ncbi:aldolase/citrate lyase family protein [Paraburkholderia ferrariae]|uniref:aldolase/citrate lyase family protein n=1 Tax=Paraburkholderia ferrariae TaxID=386056 RepID=UPI00047F5D07|nr:aldolase/citrate lyase family protein [Paraburkholderia ferrariae]
MNNPVNRFKAALADGRPQVGLWSVLANAYTTEIVAGAGFDWLMLDAEHAPNDVSSILAQLQATQASPTSIVVRPAWNDTVLIKRYLDLGAQTLLIPYVQTAEEAARAVAATRYPPDGVRGVGGSTVRATRFGRIGNYAREAAAQLCVLVQIETRMGLDNLEAIAAVPGVDGVFIGPADLAASLGHMGKAGHPEVRGAVDAAIGRLARCGKSAGLLMVDEPSAQRYFEMGARFVAVGIDAVMLARASEALAGRFSGAPQSGDASRAFSY